MPGGETEKDVSPWTTDSLKEYVLALMAEQDRRMTELRTEKDKRDEQRYEAQQIAIRDALSAADRAVSKAEMATEKRFEGVNEFREQLADQARTFLPRLEYDRAHTDLVERVDQIRSSYGEHLSNLDKAVAENTARRGGAAAVIGYLIGAAGVLIAIVAFISQA